MRMRNFSGMETQEPLFASFACLIRTTKSLLTTSPNVTMSLQRTSFDLPLRVPRGRSLPPSSYPTSARPYNFPISEQPYSSLTAPHTDSSTLPYAPGPPYTSELPAYSFHFSFNQPSTEEPTMPLSLSHTPFWEAPAAVAEIPVLPPVVLELEPVEPAELVSSNVGGSTATKLPAAGQVAEGASVEWVASFILHANRFE